MGQQILKPTARPRAYSPYNTELGAQVCEAIGNGMLVHQIAKLPGMPSASTIYSWVDKHPDFAVMYEAALMARFDLACEELLAIAKGEPGEELDRSQMRVETLQWIMTKRLPRIYGEPSRLPRRPRRNSALRSASMKRMRRLERNDGYTSAKRVTVRWIDAAQRR